MRIRFQKRSRGRDRQHRRDRDARCERRFDPYAAAAYRCTQRVASALAAAV